MIEFPFSGVETYWWLPTLAAFIISAVSSVGGMSGAFLLMPFQISILGFAGPAASSTNLLFNILSIPGGVHRHYREKRMVWYLALALLIGTIPGAFIGALLRIKFLPDTGAFKIFVGFVLLYLGMKLAVNIIRQNKNKSETNARKDEFIIRQIHFSYKNIEYEFNEKVIRLPTIPIIILAFFIGIVSGAYGIGGGAIIVPCLVTMYSIPVHTIAGATLLTTFVTSISGIGSYYLASFILRTGQLPVGPDWRLGILFGIGGFAGIYVGSRLQRYLPPMAIKILIGVLMLFIAVKYLVF